MYLPVWINHYVLYVSLAGSSGQGITATHDSFLMYTEDLSETQSWINAITRVMYEVCLHVCAHVRFLCGSVCVRVVCVFVCVYLCVVGVHGCTCVSE